MSLRNIMKFFNLSIRDGKIIDGKGIAFDYKRVIKEHIYTSKIKPSLAVIIVGADNASLTYVNNKVRACEEVGIKSYVKKLNIYTTTEALVKIIEEINQNDLVNGILVQLPLPGHIDEERVIKAIDPLKDVDCFHPINAGLFYSGNARFIPCTPQGIMSMLKDKGIKIAGEKAVVLGRSNIVGQPMAKLLMDANATVTICHSKTPEEILKKALKESKIIVSAIGKPRYIKGDMIGTDQVLIDVGINKDENHKLCGDIDTESCMKWCDYITPVPGGVGPMTIAMLLNNCIKAYELQNE